MRKESLFGPKRIPDDRSVIVISDLHLGGREDPHTARRFSRFLDFLTSGLAALPDSCRMAREAPDTGTAARKSLLPPERIILLGDILELWDSRHLDRNSAFLDALLPFLKMREMDCDVVYVTGNHDEDVAETIDSYEEESKRAEEERKGSEGQGNSNNQSPAEEKSRRLPATGIPGCPPSNFELLYMKEKQGKKPVSLKIKWGESRTLEICSRKYPAPRVREGKLGIEAGGIGYAFIHGQQFDREQITHTISRALGQRFDPVDFLQDLACISATRKMYPGNNTAKFLLIGNLLLSAILLYAAFTPERMLCRSIFGAAGGIALAGITLYGAVLFGYREPDYASSPVLTTISAIAFLGFVAVLLTGLLYVPIVFQWLFWVPFLASLYFLAVITIPVLFAFVKRRIYDALSSSKSLSPEELVNPESSSKGYDRAATALVNTVRHVIPKSSYKLFDPERYRYDSRVLVFGHTHVPDFEGNTGTDRVRLLVNTGSWVRPSASDTENSDTFAYIDRAGICCLQWNDEKGRIECYCKEKGSPKARIPLCDYIRKNNIRLKDEMIHS